MISNFTAASEFVNAMNDGHYPSSESYALISVASSELATSDAFPQCLATDQPVFEELHHSYTGPSAFGLNVCEIVRLILFVVLVKMILLTTMLWIKILILVDEVPRRQRDAIIRHQNGNNSSMAQPESVPSPEDSKRGRGDQQQNRRPRRQRGLRSAVDSPTSESPAVIPPAVNSLPITPVLPVTALIACTQDISPSIASAATTQTTASAASDSPQRSSAEVNDDRLSKIVGSDLLKTEELDPCKVQSDGSQLKKLQHVRKVAKKLDSDRSERKREEVDSIAEFASILDPTSAQHHADFDDSSRDSKAHQENHCTSKSAKKRTEIPVLVDTPCAARGATKMEIQSPSNQRGSPRTKVPVSVMPRKLCDLGGRSCMIPEGKCNEWMSCGVEYQPGESELEVRRSGNCNEATVVEEASLPSENGSIPFEKNWEQRAPVWQEKREFSMSMSGTNCAALRAIDALLEEEDDAGEKAPDGKKPAIKPRDLQLSAELVIGKRM